MVETREGSPSHSFVRELRRALRHLYDPDELRKSALMGLLPINPSEGTLSLQRALVAAIEALKPSAALSPQSNAWRTYYTLSSRYVQQFQQSEVARDLGLSPRQMRRQDSRAIRLLAGHLWTRFDLAGKARAAVSEAHTATADATPTDQGIPSRESELEWLQKSVASEPVAVPELIDGVLKVSQRMAQALGVHLDCVLPERLPLLVAQSATLRQALLNLLSMAITCVPQGDIRITAEARTGGLEIDVRAEPLSSAADARLDGQSESVEMARKLARLSGGSLDLEVHEGSPCSLALTLQLPWAEQASVLVIDDNVDILQLFQRYLEGSRYTFIGVRDADQALTIAETCSPRIIVLDVMLPGVDGWELLGRLREHPATRELPVIVCSILPQEQLALTLGAAAFVRKPVTLSALLSVLDRHSGLSAQTDG